jgi:hypothetical protein
VTRRGLSRFASSVLSAAALAGPATAQTSAPPAPAAATAPILAPSVQPEPGPRWNELSAAQRSALAPLQADWPQIDADRKRKWIEVAARFPRMKPEERERVQQRMTEWARLSPDERGRARIQFQEARQIPSPDRQERWEAYQALSDDERRELARRASAASTAAPAPAAAKTTQATRRPESDAVKRNVVATPASPTPPPKPVAPTVVQAQPGATTNLVSKPATPPVHHQAGLPKIQATQGFVDPATLLPKRGPQGAAVSAAPVPAPASGAKGR